MTIPDCFEDIVTLFSGKVYNHSLRVLGNREEAEEATQDVFLRIYKSLGSFRGEASLSTWIWRITANVCYTRASKFRPASLPLDTDISAGVPDGSPDPEQLLIDTETCAELAESISRLPVREAEAITLFYLEEMNYTQISVILDIPPGTVATALYRGRERLRRMYAMGERK